MDEKKSERKDMCEVREGKFVEPCHALYDTSEFGNPSGKKKGVFTWRLFNTSAIPAAPSRTMFGVKSGKFIMKGIIFNFCPFCGQKIRIE
jgi:hypothetical protein